MMMKPDATLSLRDALPLSRIPPRRWGAARIHLRYFQFVTIRFALHVREQVSL